jgi:hypothetical protein
MKGASKTRRLKVYYAHHGNSTRHHPYIRLAGKYLLNFGFKVGDKVQIQMEEQRIIITKLTSN